MVHFSLWSTDQSWLTLNDTLKRNFSLNLPFPIFKIVFPWFIDCSASHLLLTVKICMGHLLCKAASASECYKKSVIQHPGFHNPFLIPKQ